MLSRDNIHVRPHHITSPKITPPMASSVLLRPLSSGGGGAISTATSFSHFTITSLPFLPRFRHPRPCRLSSPSFLPMAKGKSAGDQSSKELKKNEIYKVKEDEEEDMPWLEEKALDLVEFTGTVTKAIPGPRIGQSKLPWILAVPLAYIGVSFVLAFVKTVKKFTSTKAKKKRQVNKNVSLLKDIDDLFLESKEGPRNSDLKDLMRKTGFTMDEILRKYIRYALNEKPFNPEIVKDFISLRKASELDDSVVAEVLNEISRRIVKDKGPVVIDTSGFTVKGLNRKLAVNALFRKILYLSELLEFCSTDSSLMVKEIFGVTDGDAEMLRLHTLSEDGDLDSLEKKFDDSDKGQETNQ